MLGWGLHYLGSTCSPRGVLCWDGVYTTWVVPVAQGGYCVGMGFTLPGQYLQPYTMGNMYYTQELNPVHLHSEFHMPAWSHRMLWVILQCVRLYKIIFFYFACFTM